MMFIYPNHIWWIYIYMLLNNFLIMNMVELIQLLSLFLFQMRTLNSCVLISNSEFTTGRYLRLRKQPLRLEALGSPCPGPGVPGLPQPARVWWIWVTAPQAPVVWTWVITTAVAIQPPSPPGAPCTLLTWRRTSPPQIWQGSTVCTGKKHCVAKIPTPSGNGNDWRLEIADKGFVTSILKNWE